MFTVYIGLGSNLGDRKTNIFQAVQALEARGHRILKQSPLYETDPVGGPPQGKFLNGVVAIETPKTPFQFLNDIFAIETQLGRIRTVKNAPRTIDLDILFFGDLRIDLPQLTIPHPRMFERDFVLKPLSDIAPHLIKEAKHENHSPDYSATRIN